MTTDVKQKVVSSDDELLILVDQDDNEAGYSTKARSHDGDGILHRAFSIFLFNESGRLLLQQRGTGKRLWPGYWSNSCCSHPRKGESLQLATARRLQDELHVSAELEFFYKFIYQARFGAAGSEHELCSVFLGRLQEKAEANQTEIDALRFVSAGELTRELAERPEIFTPWFILEWQQLSENFAKRLSGYTQAL
jgi:isopentenyl-diphosphate delta-isomerase